MSDYIKPGRFRHGQKKMGLWIRKDLTDAVASLAIKNKRTQTAEVEIAFQMALINSRLRTTLNFFMGAVHDLIQKEQTDPRGVTNWIKRRFGITTSSQWASNTLAMAHDIEFGTELKCEEVVRAFGPTVQGEK